MSDNFTVAADDISGVFYPRFKNSMGADGAFVADHGVWGSTTAMSWAAGLQSLATSSTAGHVSAEVDVSSLPAEDVLITVYVTMTTVGSPTGLVDVYALASLDGTTYGGDVSSYTGTAAAYSLGAAGSQNLRYLGSIKPHANTNKYADTYSLRAAYGMVPPFFALVILNNSGIALHSSGNGSDYRIRY